jgi:integrase
LFIDPRGDRKTIRLGKVNGRTAEAYKQKVEVLAATAVAKTSWDRETADWVGRLDCVLYDKLAAVGLVPKRATAERATLASFIDAYRVKRIDIKPRTKAKMQTTRDYLVEFFGTERTVESIGAGDADDWQLVLRQRGLSENTVRKHVSIAKQFFHAAVRRRMIVANPLADLRSTVQPNHSRFYFVSRDEAQCVLEACPDEQWRLLFALSRYGGLRCPSEHLGLRWCDLNWERARMTVTSPKTEHHPGGGSRVVPLFPELRPFLESAWEQAEPGTEFVITRYRDPNVNLRTQLEKIIRRAGLKPWPKLFQNLRSTRETELAESYPIHAVCDWLGNTRAVAAKHYLQTTAAHFEQAATVPTGAVAAVSPEAAQNAAQFEAETVRTDSRAKLPPIVIAGGNDGLRCDANIQVAATGLEPVTHGL